LLFILARRGNITLTIEHMFYILTAALTEMMPPFSAISSKNAGG
jgi:hypothetical protein